MDFKGKVVTIIIITFAFVLSVKAQTLYWVGGSGNFNDGKHWSLTSGGKSANLMPGENSSVIFDDNAWNSALVVTVPKYISVNSLHINTYRNIKFVKGDAESRIYLKSGFKNILDNSNFSSGVIFEFKNNYTSDFGEISSGDFAFNTDFVISGGNWKINKLKIDKDHSFLMSNSSVEFNGSFLEVGNFKASACKNISFNSAILKVYNELIFTNIQNYSVNKSYLNAKFINGKIVADDKSGIANKFTSSNIIMSPCITVSPPIKPSCSPGCDGSFVITIPSPTAACYGVPPTPPFNVIINNAVGCNTVAGLSNVGPGTYTISGVCSCSIAYGILLFDQNGFLESDAASIADPLVSTTTISAGPINCNGACTGSLATAFTGGTAPYNFTVTPPGGFTSFSTTAGGLNVTNMCAGTLTIVSKDSKNCTKTFTYNVTQPPVLNPQGATTSVSCNGACSGIAAVTPTGGTAGYTVNWSTGFSSTLTAGQTSSITGLCASVLTATITDSKNCAYPTFTANITQPPALTVTPTQTNVTCNAVCNGAASVVVSGGVLPYTYTWNPGGQNTAGVTGLCAGTRTVTIQNNGGACTNTVAFTITQPTSITITPTVSNIVCNGLCNGSASVSASGGTGPISFTWVATGPTTISTTSTIAGQCAGTYTIFASDGNTCTISTIITITQPPALTLTAVTQSVQCFGLCTGASTANVSGGNGPYSYTWSPGIITGQGTATVVNLCSGNYSLAVKDASNCPINTLFTITQPSSITLNPTTTSVTCNGLCNGVINPAPSGGIAPYTYTLLTPTGATITSAPPFNGLCAGGYTVIIKDLSTCVQNYTVNVAQPNPLVASVSSTSLTCFNVCNGSLAGSIAGGTPGYTLSWNTATSTVIGGVIGSLCSGTYTFNATDFNGCTTSSIVTLTQPPQITATINVTNPLCNSFCNGVANAGVGGGTPGYTLNWSNGFTGNPNTGLCAGSYSLIVIDVKGCNRSFTTSLTAPTPITITAVTSSASCAGSCNGSSTVTAAGGSPGYTYQFNTLPFPTTNTTGILGGFCAGGYIVSATDINGCSQSIPFTINQPIALSVALTGVISSCNACIGSATVTPANGTPTYSVAWTNTLGATVATNSVAINLCPGNYTATATDSKGCTATTSVTVLQTVSVTVVSSGGGIQCFGACTASATANAVGGTLPYSFIWAITTQTTQTAVNLCAGNYTVTASDALGCSNTSTISFAAPPNIIVAPTIVNVTCFGNCNGSINSNASGGTGTLTYSWSPGGQTTANISGLCAGTYTLKVTDANGCNKTQTIAITQSSSITAIFTSTNPSACVVNNGSICAAPIGGSGAGYTFTWSPAGGVGVNTSCYTSLGAGSYSLILADGVGCTSTLSALLTNPNGPTLTAISSSVNCFGANTGVISVTATGTALFTFTWTPAVPFVNIGNTTTASGLIAGVYVLSATDGNTCVTSQTIAVTQAPSLTVASVVNNVKCNSSCTGSITLVTTGATPGYTFAWLPAPSITAGQGTSTVSSLCAGNYSVNITDASACVSTRTFNVTQPIALSITTTSSNVQCNGACNGSVTALVSGGTGVINYTWMPVGSFTGSNTASVFNLCPGIYTVIATDANLCSITRTVQITQPPALTSTLNLVNASCSNSCNALASHTVSGGTLAYNFSWSSSAATTSTLGSLCAGNYTATVTDANGCVSAKAFTVTAPAPFTGTLTPFNPLCNAACNGSITTTLAGAQGAVAFVWIPVGAGQNPTGLCANNYTLTATDAMGCQFSSATNLVQPLALLANVSTTNPACSGNCNGIAISTPTNAQGGIVSYSWTPAAPNSPTVTALCAGNYSVVVTDGNGCKDLQTFTLTNPSVLTVNSSVGPASCGSSNGSITVIAVGGTPSYTYTWSAPIVSTNSTVVGLAAGIYTVTVNDSQNCSNVLSIPVSNSNGPSAAPITSSSISCFGQCTGAASVNIATIVGGTPAYAVSWITPPSASTVNPQTGLCAGTFTAQITDALSCILFSGVTISQPPAISILPNVGLPICNGVCNGSISLNTSGGVGPYNYMWTPAAPNSGTLLSACAGNYTVLIQDFNSCLSTQTLNLPAVLNMAAVINNTNNICFGNCNGMATVVSIAGGIPPFLYSWNNGQSGGTASPLCNGTYSVIVTDANGCNNTFTSAITSPAQITANAVVNSPICGICNGASTVTPTGGSGAFTYTWTNGSNSTVANGLCGGLYGVTIQDGVGCQITQTVPVNNSTGITSDIKTITNEQCFASCNGAATVIAVGGTTPISYNWLGPVVSNSVITGLCGGTYFLQMTDALGCVRNSSVTINSAVQLTLSPFVTSPSSCGLTNGTINVIVSGGTPFYSYLWLPSGVTTPALTGIGAGSYTLTVTDGSPCSQTNVFTISNITGPTITSTLSNVKCFGACTGSINAIGTSTSLPISYMWSNGATTPAVTGLCLGVLTLTVTDGNLCKTVKAFTITENTQVQLGAIALQQPACGLCNGSSTVSAIGGIAPYTYTWSSGSTSPITNSLCAGLYVVTIDDILSCQTTQTVIINNSSGITADTKTITNEKCFGSCNGSATVQAVGGTTPIAYNWLGPVVSNSVVTGLCGGGTYFLQMTDAVGCIRNTSVSITSAIQLTLTPTIASPSCGASNGTINVAPSGGTPTYTFAWLPAGINSSLTNIPAGSYTLTVTDNSLCAQTSVFNVNNITGPLITSTLSNINCFNACTGSITANGTTTALPVTYNWSNGATTSTVTGLCLGVISLTVTDNNLCKTIQSFTISENPQITIGALGIQQPGCGLCNGSSTVSALGGTAPYTYTWSSGSTAPITNSLCAGLYQVTINDVFGCQTTQTLIINNSSGITADTKTITNEKCFGSCNGSATVQAVGGTTPIAYNWLGPVVSNSVVTGLCGGGTYFLQMTDAVGCIRNTSVSITSAIQLTLTPAIASPSCGASNGTINVVPSGGTPAYTFAWLPAGINSSLTNIPAGSYTLTVTDNSLCAQTTVFNVNNITGPLITATLSNINCFGACTGSITANGTSTALPVTYNWSNGAFASTVTGLCSGIITLTVTDANGCKTLKTFTITNNAAINIGALAIIQPSCGLCNGGSTVTALGITPFTYSWTNGSAVNTASNLCSGLYQILITDGLGCNITQNIIINNSGGITGQTTTIQNEQCFGSCTGAATVTGIGGTAPLTYSWVAPSSTNSAVSSLCAGNYFVQMTDAQGCIRTTSLTINSAVQLTLTPFVTLPSCTLPNGTISVVPSGGLPVYIFAWSTGATTSSLSNIGAGSYTLNVTDNNLCSQSQVFNINNVTGPFVTAIQSNINCFGGCTGSITAIGTSTALPVSYLWSNGATSPNVSGLCKGVITLTVTNFVGCKTIQSYTLTDNPNIQFSLPNLQLPKCTGNCNGAITMIPSGGVLPYTYSWSPVTSTLNPISALCSGTYIATVTDNKGCAKTQTVSLIDPLVIAVTSTLNNSSCSTVADGSASLTVVGGTPSYTFAWNGPATFTSNAQNLSNVLSGTYSLNITDNNGCVNTTTLQLVPTITITADAGNNATVCPTSSVILTGTNSAGVFAYNWYLLPNNTTTISNTSTVVVPPNTVGASTIMLQTVSSVSTCVAYDTVVVNLFPLPIVDAGPSYTIPVFSTVTIGGSPTSATGLTFTWTPPFTLDNSGIPNPTASNTVDVTYTVTATDANGCLASDTMQVLIYPEIKIPNGFSPNGDGKNDKWIIDLISQFPNNVVEVYNRWGELLFYSQGYNVPFDGRYRNKDLPVGTYYYIINLNHPAYTKPYTGPLTIFR